MALSFIKSSGNIITDDFCLALAQESKADYVKDASFGTGVKKIDEQIAVTFEKLRERWEENRVDILGNKLDTTDLRTKWIIPFMKSLGYDPQFVASNQKSNSGSDYHIPYKGWNSDYAPLVHMVHSGQDFDEKDKSSRTHPNKSPQDCLQQFLNTSNHQWGILVNGKKIRVLRDFYHSITKGFLEFDLEGIFETANSEQFRVLYRILHRSRLENQYQGEQENEYDDEGNLIEKEDNCLLETFHKKSRETGVKVGNKLRDQVIEAIEKIGDGFAESLQPEDFQNGKVKDFYSEILNIIYRLLFLMFAEQKGWLPVRNSIYARTYSLDALRELAERGNYSHDDESDLWEGLKVTFKLVANGYTFSNGDVINAFGGQLFSDKKIGLVKDLPLKNKHLLDAIFRLSYFQLDKLVNRINYANLAIDELGSVYESLLDYEPKIALQNTKVGKREIHRGQFYLDDRGTDRKTTGSYYTDSRLVAQLIESALIPVIEKALEGKSSIKEKEEAILDLKVADIACGSGAFICAALEKLGEVLAVIRKGDEERPTEDQLREAKRDVLLNCIYGVDLNPMALELAKFSLWITASLPDMPLTFLDHKLKCGNSLVGATPQLIAKGIPEEAFNPVGNDNPGVCKELKKRVKRQLESLNRASEPSAQYGFAFGVSEVDELVKLREALNNRKQSDPIEVEEAEEEYYRLERMERKFKEWLMADVWTSAFFIDKTELDFELYPTNVTLENLKENQPVNPALIEQVIQTSNRNRFFHFHLEFPEVFSKGGFDCLLGNPPWEKINLEDKEFFANRAPNITEIKNASRRNQAIAELSKSNPQLFQEYNTAVSFVNRSILFFKSSGLYVHGNNGLLNTYPLFTERVEILLNSKGSCGYIIPSGFFMDDTTSPLFRYFFKKGIISSIYDFENKNRIFPHVHGQYRFCLITIAKFFPSDSRARFVFYLHEIEQINNEARAIYLSFDELILFNPNNQLLPAFKYQREVDISKKLYRFGVLRYDEKGDDQPHVHRMINMTADSHLLYAEKEKEFLPVYESKLIQQYDHRYATFQDTTPEQQQSGSARLVRADEKSNIDFEIQPRYYSPRQTMLEKNERWGWPNNWYFAYRVISSSTNERCSIASIIPKSIVSYSAYLIFIENIDDVLLHLANMNSFWFDFTVRTKVTLNFPPVILEQCPYIKADSLDRVAVERIKELVVDLSYTAKDLDEFGEVFGRTKPKQWNHEERFRVQCEIDGILARVYGLDESDIDYVLDTFSIIKRKDESKFGSYRTKEEIIRHYNNYSQIKVQTTFVNQ
jgi:hypothetical protein